MDQKEEAELFHDLLSPITTIKNINHFLLRRDDLASEVREFLEDSLKKSAEMIEKINELRQKWPRD